MSGRATSAARRSIARTRRRKWAAGLNAGLAIALAAVVAGLLHYLAARHHARADWSRSRFYGLSERTRAVLGALTNDVRVTLFFEGGHDDFTDVDNLLREYEAASPRLRVSRVDPHRDLAATQDLAQRYPLTAVNAVVVDGGGRHRIVADRELWDYDLDPVRAGQPPRKTAFAGERALTAAIHSVAFARRPVVYALTGHGERSPDDFQKGVGIGELARRIRQENVELRPLEIGLARGIPADADAVVIAGPRRRFAQPELDLLQAYLERNGRALLLLDARSETGLEEWLARWNVRVGRDLVVDRERTLTGREMFVTRYVRHPVTARIQDVATIFLVPRSVEPAGEDGPPAGRADQPAVTRLALSSDRAWGETEPDIQPMAFDLGKDRRGPLAVAVAVERGPGEAVDLHIRPTRLVVFGDSGFVANAALGGANMDFFLSALNWLLEREELMAAAPKPLGEPMPPLTPRAARLFTLAAVAGLPLAAALAAGARWLRRRA